MKEKITNGHNIKIFVSHRIDLDSESIDNPLYVPVRCGAIYDNRKNVTIQGDNTGDNISEKRNSFCELTVQYWAWKNVDADYYGVCHYRRFLSFSDKVFENVDAFNHVEVESFDEFNFEEYGLDQKNMVKVIQQYDVLSLRPMDIHKTLGNNVTVYDSLKNNPTVFDINAVDTYISIFKEKYPDFSETIDKYFQGHIWRAFNCYILKKDIFKIYNEMLFDILFELEKRIDSRNYNREQLRLVGYMGEVTFGIFYLHLQNQGKYKLKELQLIKINHPEKRAQLQPAFNENNIAISMASSDGYVPFLATLLESIKENSINSNNYDIIVISKDIKEHNKRIVVDMFNEYPNFSIRFVNISTYLTNRKFHTSMHITPMTYMRLVMQDIAVGFEKIVYMDCDVVVNDDVAKLYNTELGNNLIAAARDTVMAGWCNVPYHEQIKYNKNVLKIKNNFNYFNAGIIVINLSEFRKLYSVDELLDLAASKNWKWFDQDVLNIICEDRVKFLENEWNVMSHQHDFDYQLPEFFAPKSIYDNYINALEKPKAIHYAGRFIPCFVPNVDLAVIFWKYARNTPYYEVILAAMIDNKVGIKGTMDGRSGIRKLADKVLPKGSKRRNLAKSILPKGSKRWTICKKLYLWLIK